MVRDGFPGPESDPKIRMKIIDFCACAAAFLGVAASPVAIADPVCNDTDPVPLCAVQSLTPPARVAQIVSAPTHKLLFLLGTDGVITTVDLATMSTTTRTAFGKFTSLALSPSGDVLFAADYPGYEGAFGEPGGLQNYVHRFDLNLSTWDSRRSYTAYGVVAISDSEIVLRSGNQWIGFTHDRWDPAPDLTMLSGPQSFDCHCYYGDFRYDESTGRLLHGGSNLSSNEIVAVRLTANGGFAAQESSGGYGSAQNYGGSVAMATDFSAFYYGRLQVDPLDVSHSLRVFPDVVLAATGDLAFAGTGNYYDAHTGAFAGRLPVSAYFTAITAERSRREIWAYDYTHNLVHQFAPYADLFIDGFE